MKTLFIAIRTLVYMVSFVLLFWWLAQNVRPLDKVLGVMLPAWTEIIGVVVMLPGSMLLLVCAGLFVVRGRGTVAVFDPPREFVALGPYQYVRNPMYIGGLTLLVGLGLYQRSISILLLAAALFLLLDIFVRSVEEPGLERRFSHSYLTYKQSINRWIPNMSSLIKVLAGAPPAKIALFAPLVFILHAAEEAPTFVSWFNSLVQPGISQQLFLQVNASVLVITIVLAVFAALANEKTAVLLFLGWLSFFMFANAIFHVIATLVHARYSPGTVTAVTLYLPYFFWFLSRLRGDLAPSLAAIVAAIVVGSGPMIVHGYLIVFKGERFF